MILVVSAFLVTIIYAVFLAWCQYQWKRIEDTSQINGRTSNVKVDVIVPVRNESVNMHSLLESLIQQDYPKESYSVIIVDDHSTDDSLIIAESLLKSQKAENIFILTSPGKSKKEALNYAIRKSEAELIITTDADTIRGRSWITSIVTAYSKNDSLMVCSPVKLSGARTFFQKIQQAEFMGLNVIAAAGIKANMPLFCNGANLAFRKKIFDEVSGYDGMRSISGDDTQLMLKINQMYSGKIFFNRNSKSIVCTGVVDNEKDLVMQRRRWASKITTSLTGFTIFIALNAWLVHAMMLVWIVKLFFNAHVITLLILFLIKIIPEIIILKSAGKFFNEKISVMLLVAAQPFYCIYIVVVGLLSPFKFNWKGRGSR